MRDIKFRAWDRVAKEMIYDGIEFEIRAISRPLTIVHESAIIGYSDYSDTFDVQQFTGLLDKNGKEIYEGDIVRCDSSRRCPHEIIWTDVANQNFGSTPGWYLSGLGMGYSFTGQEEVIGNKYESPELISND